MKHLIITLLFSTISFVLFSQKPVYDSVVVFGELKLNALHSNNSLKNNKNYKILLKVFYSETDSIILQTSLNSFQSYRFSFVPKSKLVKITVSALNNYSIIDEKVIQIMEGEFQQGQRNTFVADLIEKEKEYSAGDELILYTRQMYLGYSLQMVGGSVVLISTLVAKEKTPIAGILIGSAISTIGTIVVLTAPNHIKKAGLLLNENGVGVKVKL